MPKLNTVMQELADDLAKVDRCIDEFLYSGLQNQLLREILHTVRGGKGKMLRPALLLLSGKFGTEHAQRQEQLYRLAAAVEVVHTASLVHDDIVDDSPLRRGNPSVQSKYGKDMAVYTGDFLLCRVMYHMMDDDLDKAVGKGIAHTVEQMCLGEVGQYENRWNTEVSAEQYLRNIYGKTAAMFVTACKLGAMVSGADDEIVELMGEFGQALGIMFQLRDDLLDYTSSEKDSKKPVNLDFYNGIFTMPALHTFRHPQYGPRLKEIAQTVEQDGEKDFRREIKDLVSRSGGIRMTRIHILRSARQAESLLDKLPKNSARLMMRQILQGLYREYKKDKKELSKPA